jgi:hypothetical protein
MGRRGELPLVEGLGHGSGDQSQVPGLAAARPDAEAALCVAAAGIQAVGAEVVPALIAAQQALAYKALFAMMANGDVATLDQMQLVPVGGQRYAGEIQRNHGKSIETWKLLPVAYT